MANESNYKITGSGSTPINAEGVLKGQRTRLVNLLQQKGKETDLEVVRTVRLRQYNPRKAGDTEIEVSGVTWEAVERNATRRKGMGNYTPGRCTAEEYLNLTPEQLNVVGERPTAGMEDTLRPYARISGLEII